MRQDELVWLDEFRKRQTNSIYNKMKSKLAENDDEGAQKNMDPFYNPDDFENTDE